MKKYFTIGFTGTQRGMNYIQYGILFDILPVLKPDFVSHGDCIGADAQLHQIAQYNKISIHIYPPEYDLKRAFCAGAEYIFRPDSYLQRNKSIVNSCDLLIATPGGSEITRSGTWSTIRYARKVQKPHIIILP